MKLPIHPFTLINWTCIEPSEHKGESGTALWQTNFLKDIRIRKVTYSENYKADHWCSKGHIIYILRGEMTTELQDGRKYKMSEGMTYITGDDDIPHRSSTVKGAELLIID